MQTNSIGLIVLNQNLDDEILMTESNDAYSLPEISMEAFESGNLLEKVIQFMDDIGVKYNNVGLLCVLDQEVPDKKEERVITYYFITMIDDSTNILPKYQWVSKPYEKLDKNIYPQQFIDLIEKYNKYGWEVGNIRMIKTISTQE